MPFSKIIYKFPIFFNVYLNTISEPITLKNNISFLYIIVKTS